MKINNDELFKRTHWSLFGLLFAEVIVMLVPCDGSETYVNGKRVEDAIQLRSGTYFIFVNYVENTII